MILQITSQSVAVLKLRTLAFACLNEAGVSEGHGFTCVTGARSLRLVVSVASSQI